MKKVRIVISLLFCIFLVSSCTGENATKTSVQSPAPIQGTSQNIKEKSIKDYFSLKENTKYIYAGMGNEYASYSTIVDYTMGNRIQIRKNNGGTETVSVMEYKDGELIKVFSKNEIYYRENFLQNPSNNEEILLKEPLEKGTTWMLADNTKRYISGVETSIATPMGIFKTIVVTTEGKNDKTIDYYAPNIGLVKTVSILRGLEISSSLSKIENDVPFSQTLDFFYPNVKENKINFVSKKLNFKTNDITKIVIEKAYKVLPKGNVNKVLSSNTKIKSLYLNKDNMVYVDFTKALISEMNAGAGYESTILQSITNTLGRYYGVSKVYITVEGSPYSSGHIVMRKSEAFTVNFKNCVELK
jgi:hypothetical protein